MRALTARLEDLERGSCGTEIRAGIELLMDTGRRPAEIAALAFDCLTRDSDGSPVLVYDNRKSARDGRRLPVSETTATVITRQQRRVRERFPAAPAARLVLLSAYSLTCRHRYGQTCRGVERPDEHPAGHGQRAR